MLTPDGFPGQRLRVLSRPLVARALSGGVTSRLLVTDAGHFPHAVSHGRHRRSGASEAVVIICVDGLGWCEIDDRVVAVPTGSALVIPPHVPHLYRADRERPWTTWWLHAAGEDIPYLLEAIGSETGERVIAIRDLFRAVAAVEHAVEAMERDETLPNLLTASGSAWTLLTQLAVDRASGSRSVNRPIEDARNYLREHFAEPVSVPELARLAGLSTSHFSALFRASTGGGVIEYVKSLRMSRARELLATTSASMTEIARAIGYTDAFYFSRQFRRANGCSPSDYRQGHRGETA